MNQKNTAILNCWLDHGVMSYIITLPTCLHICFEDKERFAITKDHVLKACFFDGYRKVWLDDYYNSKYIYVVFFLFYCIGLILKLNKNYDKSFDISHVLFLSFFRFVCHNIKQPEGDDEGL